MTDEFDIEVNGRSQRIAVDSDTPLIYVLRNELGLKGTRFGCGNGECGACTVLIDGVARQSCQIPVSSVTAQRVLTIEGNTDLLSRLQQSMIEHQAAQCAYCLSGVVMSATALLTANPTPSESEIRQALNGNLCRCGAQHRMLGAIMALAERTG